MLRDHAYTYFIEKDFNCAESTLHMLNAEYGFGLKEEDYRLMSGFGAGLGCGMTCGVLCADMAGLSRLTVSERAHVTPGFRELCAEYVEVFQTKLGHTDCSVLKPEYRKDKIKCLPLLEAAADVFEEFVTSHGLVTAKEEKE